jgi:hypothetical protein
MSKPITFILILAVVTALVIAFAVLRDDIEDDALGSLRGFFTRSGEGEKSGAIPLDGGRQPILALCDGRLASLSADRFMLYDKSGRERFSRALSYEIPALTVAGSKVILFDRAGTGAIVADSGGIRAELDFPVLTAAGNTRGQYILVTRESGVRAAAYLYDQKDRLIYKWLSAERYILAASLSPSGSRMAVAALGQQGETAVLRATFLDTSNPEPLATADIEDEIPLGIYSPDNNHVCILTDSGVYFYTDAGVQLGFYPFDGYKLLSAHPTDEALFLNIGRNEGGQYSGLVCLSYTGAELGSVRFIEGPDGIAAAGRRGASLEAGVLTLHTIEGTRLNSEVLGSSGARGLLLSPDGSILLLYSDHAQWYNK